MYYRFLDWLIDCIQRRGVRNADEARRMRLKIERDIEEGKYRA